MIDPLAAFGGVSPLQGGDYICHKARVSLPLVRGRRERSERGGRSAELLCKRGYQRKFSGRPISFQEYSSAGNDKIFSPRAARST